MPAPSSHPLFIRRRCIRFRHTASSCSACVDACGKKALTLQESNLMLASSMCSKCGACVGACPVEALEMCTPSNQEIERALASAAHGGVLSVSCQRTAGKNTGVQINCLARLDPSVLLHSAAQGVSTIDIVTGQCSGCPERAHQATTALLASAQRLAALTGTQLVIRHACDDRGVDVSRRRMFSRLFEDRSFSSMADEAGDDQVAALRPEKIGGVAINEPAQHVPDRRLRLLSSLKRLKATAGATESGPRPTALEDRKALAERFQRPVIDPAQCSGCALCAAVCPTGALTMSEKDKTQTFSCRPSLCIGCKLCAEVCYQNAVSLQGLDSLEELLSDPRLELFKRALDEDMFSATWEDKLGAMIDAPVYRT